MQVFVGRLHGSTHHTNGNEASDEHHEAITFDASLGKGACVPHVHLRCTYATPRHGAPPARSATAFLSRVGSDVPVHAGGPPAVRGAIARFGVRGQATEECLAASSFFRQQAAVFVELLGRVVLGRGASDRRAHDGMSRGHALYAWIARGVRNVKAAV